MVQVVLRRTLCSSRRCLQAPSLLQGVDLKSILTTEKLPGHNKKSALRVPKPTKRNDHQESNTTNGNILNLKFNSDPRPSPLNVLRANGIFNTAKKKLNWAVYKFEDLPGEKERLDREEQLHQDFEDSDQWESLSTEKNEEWDDSTISENEQNRLNKISKKESAIALKNSLPEILLLGRCNVGKSSLINNILNDLNTKEPLFKYANVKDFPGLTPSLNFYNVGGLFRVVDSPGYGEKGKPWQGDLTLEYIANRRNLKKAYVLVSMKDGLKQPDYQLIEYLTLHRIPYGLVITKIDKLINKVSRNRYFDHINESFLDPIKELVDPKDPIQPDFHFVNNVSTTIKRRTGLDELRVDFLKASGYDQLQHLKPLFTVKPHDLNQKEIRKVGDMEKRFSNNARNLKQLKSSGKGQSKRNLS